MSLWRGVVGLLAVLIACCTPALAQSDTEPPILLGLDFTPVSVDVTGGPADVVCAMTTSDSPSGVEEVLCHFRSPSGAHQAFCRAYSPSSGDIYNGTFQCTAVVPQYAEEGVWTAKVTLHDNAGNDHVYGTDEIDSLGFPTDLEVISEPDGSYPVLVDLNFTPVSVDVTGGPADVVCAMTTSDSPSGVEEVLCHFRSPSGAHQAFCRAYSPSSGDIYNGTFQCTAVVPQYAEEGVWTAKVTLHDNAGNDHVYGTDEIDSLGFPTNLNIGFLAGPPTAVITSPRHGKRIRGDSVTVRARLVEGSPTDISPTLGVRFDYRALPFGDFAQIQARNPNHPNPDTSYPYFTHWDVSEVPEGDHELRAVAHDLDGTPDPAPETITITIDHAGPADIDEFVNAEGRQESQAAVDSASEGKIASGDHTEASTATELTLPPGSLLYTTDTAKLVYPDPADEEGQLEQTEQSIGAFVDLSLLSGQADLEAGLLGDLNISFADANQDGVVDGTSIRETDLELRHLDTGTGSYIVIPSIVLTEHNMVHAEPGFLGKFALAGPLMPRMWVEADKATLAWEAVSAATSYVVYRGLLSALVDLDLDGLPDTGYGDCVSHLDIDPADLVFVDSENPVSNDGFFYLVGFVGPDGSAGLGNASAGLRRVPAVVCP